MWGNVGEQFAMSSDSDPLLTGLDFVRSTLRARWEAAENLEHPDLIAAEREILSKAMAYVDDACEALQFDAR